MSVGPAANVVPVPSRSGCDCALYRESDRPEDIVLSFDPRNSQHYRIVEIRPSGSAAYYHSHFLGHLLAHLQESLNL